MAADTPLPPGIVRFVVAAAAPDSSGDVPYLYYDFPADIPDETKDELRARVRDRFAEAYPELATEEIEVQA